MRKLRAQNAWTIVHVRGKEEATVENNSNIFEVNDSEQFRAISKVAERSWDSLFIKRLLHNLYWFWEVAHSLLTNLQDYQGHFEGL